MHEYAFKIPENLPSDVVAPLLCAGTTVFRPLKEAGVKPGKRVSIVGIGGLGHLAIQFAKAMGADAVVAVSRSPNKEKDVRDLGATDSSATRTRSKPLRPKCRLVCCSSVPTPTACRTRCS
ncbi:hypothetical protein PC121_g22464 [Phytophthora cactorum]|nr:hypothetical protein PC121_g22464 [Phytophthora cactorum]KAG4039503.1 hypothetical protein PC123_g24949 [Phytophthora cactorum]